MRKALPVTPAEFEILQVLWEEPGPAPVSRVHEILMERKDVAYTTVMTLLDTMARKGSVRRRKQGKAYHYRPAADRENILSIVVDDFARSYFGGRSKLGRFLRKVEAPRRVAAPASPEEDLDVVLL